MRQWRAGILWMIAILGMAACGRTVQSDIAARFPGANLNSTNIVQGYFYEGSNIVFVFDEAAWGLKPESVEVRGTFDGWKQSPDWTLTRSRNAAVWYLLKPVDAVRVPSNSGQPEFKFVADGKWLQPLRTLPDGYAWPDGYNGRNAVILLPGDDPREIAARALQAATIRTNYDSDEQMANFRAVVTGHIARGVLFRSYNPVMSSKPNHPREKDRLLAAQKLMENNHIRSVINLSDTPAELANAHAFAYYQSLVDGGNVLFVNTSYSTVYLRSDSADFAKSVAQIVRFVDTHKAPFLIHCRLGNDRTGVMTAVLEAFMGATWSQIETDYLHSNELGIGEYRSSNLLRYSLEHMLKTQIAGDSVLTNEMRTFMKDSAGLTDAELSQFYAKLSTRP